MDVRRFAALALTLPVLALGACTDEGSSKEPSPTPSSESPSPTVTSTGPSIPPEARGDDEASAKAFLKYYFETLSEAMVTGETATLEALAFRQCRTCRNFVALIRDTYDLGGHYETEGWAVEAAVSMKWPGARQAFALRTRQKARTLFDENDKVVHRNKPSLTAMRIIIRRDSGVWRVVRLDEIR